MTEFDGATPFPGEAVEAAQRETAALYGARHLRYSTGGASLCVKAAMLCMPGDVLAAENSHRSVFDGARLAGIRAVLIKNRTRAGLPLPLSADDLSAAYQRAGGRIKGVALTSPDYYGQCADVMPIVEFCQKNKLILLADSAHGAHFFADPTLFPRCLAPYADFTALSAHKTLRAYTQTAYLACNNDGLLKKLDQGLALLGTTSPSYPMLAQLSAAALWERENAGGYRALKAAADALKRAVKTLPNDDPMRLVVDAAAYGMTGRALYDRLVEGGLGPEKYDGRYCVCIVTLSDTPENIGALQGALTRILY
jgi:arginine/lysine/ornithine decarboxylase